MKILKKGGGVVEKRGEEETKSMPHAPVVERPFLAPPLFVFGNILVERECIVHINCIMQCEKLLK